MVVVKLLLTEPPQDKGSLGIYLVLCLVRGGLLPHSVKKRKEKKTQPWEAWWRAWREDNGGGVSSVRLRFSPVMNNKLDFPLVANT